MVILTKYHFRANQQYIISYYNGTYYCVELIMERISAIYAIVITEGKNVNYFNIVTIDRSILNESQLFDYPSIYIPYYNEGYENNLVVTSIWHHIRNSKINKLINGNIKSL